jgi:hypothetical protein
MAGRSIIQIERNLIMSTFSVWVGGVEVNDYLLTLEQANELALIYLADDYDDVSIQIEGSTK